MNLDTTSTIALLTYLSFSICYTLGMAEVEFLLDRTGGEIVLRSDDLVVLEHTAVSGIMATISSQFFHEFGFEGKFEVKDWTTNRVHTIVKGADRRTTAALKTRPGWLATFMDNLQI